MEIFRAEVKANFERAFVEMPDVASHALDSLNSHKAKFEASYFRVVSLQAWRSELLETLADEETLAFFLEAHNDALASHALARQGAWRVSLMSLRSLIENTVFGLYYFQHPVELELWSQSKHKLGFSGTVVYLEKHPALTGVPAEILGLDVLKEEYSTLSRAVHGSAKSFRMTRDGGITGLNTASDADLGAWLAREKNVIVAVNLLLLCFFRQHLLGAAKPNLKKAISAIIPGRRHSSIKAGTGVILRF